MLRLSLLGQVPRQRVDHAGHVDPELAARHQELALEEHEAVQGENGGHYARSDRCGRRSLPVCCHACVAHLTAATSGQSDRNQGSLQRGMATSPAWRPAALNAVCTTCFRNHLVVMTRVSGQTGSFLNMAPEVVLGKPYNEKADIFSLGCCIFEARLVFHHPPDLCAWDLQCDEGTGPLTCPDTG